MRLPIPRASASTAATVTAAGRWPGARGTSLARASALRCSERERRGPDSAVAMAVAERALVALAAPGRRLRLRRANASLLPGEGGAKRPRGRRRILGLG